MAVFKCTYIFNGGKTGWSESWYTQQPSDVQDAMSEFATTVGARQALLGYPNYIEAIRVSAVNSGLVPALRTFPKPRIPLAPVPVTSLTDSTYNAIAVRFNDQSGDYRRTMFLRGVPDSWISYNVAGQPIWSAVMTKLLNAWLQLAFARALKLSWQAVNRADTGVTSRLPVTGLSFVPESFVFYTCESHGFLPGDQVRVAGLKGSNLMMLPPSKGTPNGIGIVSTVPDPNTFSLGLRSDQFGPTPALYTVGYALKRSVVYPILYNWEPLGFTRKQTGRAFFVPAGHARPLRGG